MAEHKYEAVRPLVTPQEAARVLGMCYNTLLILVKKNAVPHVRVGGMIRFRPAELEAFTGEKLLLRKERKAATK